MRTLAKILVVDDNPEAHEVVDLLFSQGAGRAPQVLHAENGQQALAMVAANPDLDVIVLDLVMPVLDGFEVLARLSEHRHWRRIPVFVFSGDREEVTRALALGARDFVKKPGDLPEIQLRILNLVEAKHRAEASEKAKLDFLAIVSHELRTPMNGVLGMVDALRDSGLGSEPLALLDVLDQSARRMMGLVENVLHYLGTENPHQAQPKTGFDLETLVRTTVAEFADEARRTSVTLDLRVPEALPPTVGWPESLRVVLHHLIGNAVKFSAGGRVDVSLTAVPTDSGEGGASRVTFEVTDTGVGLPSHGAAALFEPFTQGDASATRAFGGLGIGLAIASRLVDQLGGVLVGERGPAGGSAFRFSLVFASSEGF